MKGEKTGSKKKRITTRDLSKKALKGKGRIKRKPSAILDCKGSECTQLRVVHVPRATELIINVGCEGPHGLFITTQPL